MDSPKIQAEGRLERAGSARYSYGSHALIPLGDHDIRFILRSDTTDLRELEGQRVRITGALMEGYPPNEGDPKLVDVLAITPLEQEE